MKKKVIAIVVMVALVMSMVACGSTQAQPVQESTPAPKTETAVKPAEETKVETPVVAEEPKVEESEVKEEPAENENVVGGIDFTDNKKYGTPNIEIINKKANFDEPKVIVASNYAMLDETVEAVLSSGESVTCDSQKGTYVFYYYVPKTVSQIKRTDDGINDLLYEHKSVVAARICDKKCENTPYEITVTYEDGTEETITVYVTMK